MTTPSSLDVQDYALQQALGNVHTCMPAEVVRVHAGEHKNQFVDVLPGLMRTASDEDGNPIDEALPLIPMVPVGYIQGGGFFISVPLAVGDIVTLVFAERSLDQWLEVAKKSSGRAIDPGDVSTHPLEGAIALPCGPAPRSALLPSVSATDLVIGKDGGARIHIKSDGVIHLGDEAGASFVALASKVATELDRIKTDLSTLKSAISGAAVLAQDGGATFKTNIMSALSSFPSSPGDVAATKVKAD